MSSGKKKLSSFVIANNDDLLIEIIVRLPTKSIFRFKCVSKHWLFPYFRSSILWPPLPRQPFKHDFVPLTNKPITAPLKCLNFLKHPSGLRIQNSCHGSLCYSSFRDRHLEHDCYICNPTTKQFVKLPPPGGRIIHGVTSVYNPVRSPHYKVACVRSPDSYVSVEEGPYISYQIEIYSSEARSWRLSGDPFMAPVNTQFNGHLHLVEIYGPCTTKFDVYEMERDILTDLNYYAFSILGVIWEVNDAESCMVLYIPGKAIRYNLKDMSFDKICEFDPGRADIASPHSEGSLKFFYGFQYIETLACV
ncbi:F-box protein [Citrus sinensis]|uniref:Uncharacterized protein n=1 Tax=Citrus clementina TaxID=85681 RepID=V4S7F6_CITCL|nr:hypothetical protein CICLE_v10006870mg [Citrus x clementina]KAH9648010.1 F-box protein [Citrus sinensis]